MEKQTHPEQFKHTPTLHAPVCSGVIPYLTSNNVAGVSEMVSVADEGRHVVTEFKDDLLCIQEILS